MAISPKNKKYIFSAFYNSVSAFVLGFVPTIIYSQTADTNDFLSYINNSINNSFILYYFVFVALVGLMFKIHVFISTRKCGDCNRKADLDLFSKKLFDPFFSVMLGASGCMLALAALLAFQKEFNNLFFFTIVIGLFCIAAISSMDADLNKKSYEEISGEKA
jgi:hypothetical protein